MPSIPILPIEIDPWPFKPMCDDPECWCQRDQDDDEARADQQQEGTDEG